MENEILDYFHEEEYYKGKIIAIKYFYFESQATLYAARLKEFGIKSFISNTNTITAFPLGNGGIGLHIREIDKDHALKIIQELDHNNVNEPHHLSFHDADHEDIAYQKNLVEQKVRKNDPILILVAIILALLLLRAFLRAAGIVFAGDSF